jgi:hypothetical protein
MITQRQLDEIHIAAQEYAAQAKNEFAQSLMGNRANRQQGAMRPPAPQPQMMNGGNPNITSPFTDDNE